MSKTLGNGHASSWDEVPPKHHGAWTSTAQGWLRVDELESELGEHRPQLKRDERALALLMGEDTTGPGRPKKKAAASTPRGTVLGEDRLAAIEAAIIRYAADHGDEFRQVDIRTMPDAPSQSSGAMAVAFEKLRERGVIRFARQEGNAKVFRLTREAATKA